MTASDLSHLRGHHSSLATGASAWAPMKPGPPLITAPTAAGGEWTCPGLGAGIVFLVQLREMRLLIS